jgi:hypothetical protein
MSFASERSVIESRFKDNWNTTDIAWSNTSFDIPSNDEWVKFTILNGATIYRSLDGGKRHTGVIVVQIFVPVNTGTNTARVYSDTIASIFDSQSFNDVVCDTASIYTIGETGKWHQMNVEVPFWRDE